MDWFFCEGQTKTAWIGIRDLFQIFILNPQLSLPLLWIILFLILYKAKSNFFKVSIHTTLLVIIFSLVYSPLSTKIIERILDNEVPYTLKNKSDIEAIIIPGRGPKIAIHTTKKLAEEYEILNHPDIYVSGDNLSTGELLSNYGIDKNNITGDSCAQTTLENAIFAKKWLLNNNLKPNILLITDKWHLARAVKTFNKFKINVYGIGIDPNFPARQSNKLALREISAFYLYKYLNRFM